MKLLITGAKGQLGTELCTCLANGHSELGVLPAAFLAAEVTAIDLDGLDITDQAAVFAFVGANKPDLIINCAAYTNVDACEENPLLAMKINALGPRYLSAAAAAIGASFVHVSTDYVFSGDAVTPRREWDSCDPASVYGASKLLGEQYALAANPRTTVMRTAWLYGYYGPNFVETILKAAAERDSLKVVNDQRGNPTNAADLAHHIFMVAASQEYGIYHCTGAGECSWFDFASRIVALSGLSCVVNPCTTAEFPRPAKRPAYSSLDNLMLRATVGDLMSPWEEALERYFANRSLARQAVLPDRQFKVKG